MSATNIDYANTYFEFPELTKIHGAPSYPTLRIIHDEIKANAHSVECNLGGGAHGHYGLVVTPEEYAMVPATIPYIRPVHPGPLVIPTGTSQVLATGLREDHKEKVRLFREVNDVERRIIKQVVQAIDTTYLKTLRNSNTNTITCKIPTIFQYLYQNYGLINDDQLTEAETKLRSFQYDVLDPLVKVFDEVEELQHLGNAAQDPYSEAQLIKFALQIIKNTHDFETGIRTWIDLPRIEKKWAKFKTHFEAAHRSLREIRGTTMRSSSFNQINMILAEVHSVKESVLSAIAESVPDTTSTEESYDRVNQVSNSEQVTLDMLSAIKDLQKEIKELKSSKLQNKNIPKSSAPGQYKGYATRVNKSKYCHTHGACAHESKYCKNKRPGHKDEATFENKLDGSTAFCQGVE